MLSNDDVPFSERYGYVHRAIQIESMDEALRNGLWNAFVFKVWDSYIIRNADDYVMTKFHRVEFCQDIWLYYFKKTKDDFDKLETAVYHSGDDVLRHELRDYFLNANWYQVFDLLEFVAERVYIKGNRNHFTDACNDAMEREKSGYRMVKGIVAPIIDETQIHSIETAINNNNIGISTHLQSALKLLSDRTSPEYRNSIKESVSAVESQARIITGITKGGKSTLGRLLIKLNEEYELPVTLKTAFMELNKYASGGSGARHGLTSQPEDVDFDMAKFMLVTCSAFVNYLESRSHLDRLEKRELET